MTGVRINGGKLHVFRPGIRPVTRCGKQVGRHQTVEDGIDPDTVDTSDRCRLCFPGTATRTTATG